MHGQSIYAFLIFINAANCFPEFLSIHTPVSWICKLLLLIHTHEHLILKHFFAKLRSRKCYLVFVYTLIIREVEYVFVCLLAHIPSENNFSISCVHFLILLIFLILLLLFPIDFEKLFVVLHINLFLLFIYVAYIFSH